MAGSSGSDSGEPPRLECDLPLGRPGLVAHNRLLLNGWAASPDGVTGVIVNVDDRAWTAGYGLDTPTLEHALPGVAGAGRSGYGLEIDTSDWAAGVRRVAVAAYDSAGRRSVIEGEVEIQPFGSLDNAPSGDPVVGREQVTLSLESPRVEGGKAEVDGPLAVRGWAYAKGGIDAVLVTLDGVIQHEALRPISRPDLAQNLGTDAAAEAGFCLVLDAADCPVGRHSLTVAALSHDGEAAGVECDLLCRPVPVPVPVQAMPGEAPGSTPRAGENGAGRGGVEAAWQERALLAEADAARCRAEARLSLAGQERARRELMRATSDPATSSGQARRELTAARVDLVNARREIEAGAAREAALGEELDAARGELDARRSELQAERAQLTVARDALAQRAAELESVERSPSWKLTRPLRALKRIFTRHPPG